LFPPSPTSQPSPIFTGIWSSEGNALHVPKGTVTEIPNLILDFTVESGEDAYFIFTSVAQLNSVSGQFGWPAFLQFTFRLDGVTPNNAFTNFYVPEVNTDNFSSPVTFFYTLFDFTAGTYNLTVGVYSTSDAASIFLSRLMVQTFNS